MAHVKTTTLAEQLYVNGTSASAIQTTRGVSVTSGIVTFDFGQGNNFNITLDSVTVLAAPLNATAGQSGIIFITQDSAGNRVMSFDAAWRFPNSDIPSLSTAVNAVDGLCYVVRVGGALPIIACQIIQGI